MPCNSIEWGGFHHAASSGHSVNYGEAQATERRMSDSQATHGWPQDTLGLSYLILQCNHMRRWNPNANGAYRLGKKEWELPWPPPHACVGIPRNSAALAISMPPIGLVSSDDCFVVRKKQI
jgi:hypothetical protein